MINRKLTIELFSAAYRRKYYIVCLSIYIFAGNYLIALKSAGGGKLLTKDSQNINLGEIQRFNVFNQMVVVPGGEFLMGGVIEHPIRKLYIAPFLIDVCETTKSEWDSVAKWANQRGYDLPEGGCFGTSDHPVMMVNWFDVVKWCNAKSEFKGVEPSYYSDSDLRNIYTNGVKVPFVKWLAGYRLPTEAEWEKAAKGGSEQSNFPWQLGQDTSPTLANYKGSGNFGTVAVASYRPNGFGLFDMAGNVREWCWDIWGSYNGDDYQNPRGLPIGRYRVIRGGSWLSDRERCRAAYRYFYYSKIPSTRDYQTGFRVVVQIKS